MTVLRIFLNPLISFSSLSWRLTFDLGSWSYDLFCPCCFKSVPSVLFVSALLSIPEVQQLPRNYRSVGLAVSAAHVFVRHVFYPPPLRNSSKSDASIGKPLNGVGIQTPPDVENGRKKITKMMISDEGATGVCFPLAAANRRST